MPSPLPELFLHTQSLRGPRQAARLLNLATGPMTEGSGLASARPAACWHTTRNLASEDPQEALCEMLSVCRLQTASFPLYLLDVILLREACLPKRLGEPLLDRVVAVLDIERCQVLALAYERGTHSCLRLIVSRIHTGSRQPSRLPDKRDLQAAHEGVLDLLESQRHRTAASS